MVGSIVQLLVWSQATGLKSYVAAVDFPLQRELTYLRIFLSLLLTNASIIQQPKPCFWHALKSKYI